MGLLQFLWRQLPDRCGAPNCMRQGVRGNENIVVIGDYRVLMCHECTKVQMARRGIAQEYADMSKRVIDALNEDE